MADNQSTQTGGASSALKGGSSGSSTGGSTGGSSGSGAGVADQARETLRNATDRASDAWEDASRYGSRYYRQATRAVSDTDTMAGLFIAGALGFGLGWLMFGQHSFSSDYVARRMSTSSERDY